METETIIIVSVFSAAWFVLLLVCIILCTQVSSLRRKIHDLNNTGRLRVQKLQMSPEGNHAFNNPALVPDEELSRRGFSMYQASDGDLESGRGTDRQTGGEFVEELSRKIDDRQQRQSQANGHPPPFLLQSIEDSKKKTRSMVNPVANPGRHSNTNPNFIY
ncbi:uncharacterized protein LOC123696761 [Colias croceus]|uniref:uncharacterized protein LOC123696761 n=1 Tax=Colias crocea TaxID=72248 RepID=UPI001E27F5D7|nr:uncharacterized protein LOC123696761 [Colias croceus]CAG4993389.1 unnamed protein product [Colias eurytheme]